MPRISPDHDNTGWPEGVPYIIGNEGCERFSFYGMKAILFVHLLSLFVIARETTKSIWDKCETVGNAAGQKLANQLHDAGQTISDLLGEGEGKFVIAKEAIDKCVAGGAERSAELCQGMLACAQKFTSSTPEICQAATEFSQCIEKTGGDLSKHDVHLFIAGVYAFPMIGAILADRLLGKYPTIIWLSLVYCAGHAVLAVGENSIGGMQLGLLLIAVGSGGIKPCVSAHVGDQFGKKNFFRIQTVYQMFYFIINFGSFFSTLLIPWVRNNYGTSVAFGIPGVLMFIATIAFWMGRNKFVHIPPSPGGKLGLFDFLSSTALFMTFGHLFFSSNFDLAWPVLLGISAGFLVLGLVLFGVRQSMEPDDGFLATFLYSLKSAVGGNKEANSAVSSGGSVAVPGTEDKEEDIGDRAWILASNFFGPTARRFGLDSTEGMVAVLKIASIFIFFSTFWALFDQHGSSWVEQAGQMNLHGWDKSQISAANPIMVMILIPITAVVYKFIENKLGIPFGPLRRIGVGMFVTSGSFVIAALVQTMIVKQGLGQVDIMWQILQYLVITLAEVMVSITGLEFAYTQAPKKMKSTILGLYLLTVALGNVFVSVMTSIDIAGKVKAFAGADSSSSSAEGLVYFFWFFALVMAVTAVLFMVRAKFYKTKTFTQD